MVADKQAIPWARIMLLLDQDWRRLKKSAGRQTKGGVAELIFPGFLCVMMFRISFYFYRKGRLSLARFFCLCNVYLTGADIAPRSDIGEGLLILYPAGIAIDCQAGRNLTIMALSGIGLPQSAGDDDRDAPVLGDGVFLDHHTGIYGSVKIASGVRLTPGCIVHCDVEGPTVLVGRRLKFRANRQPQPNEALNQNPRP